MSIEVPFRTVIEWKVFPPSSPPGVECLFNSETVYHLGWYSKSGTVYYRCVNGYERLPLDQFDAIKMYACLPKDLIGEIVWNYRHNKELDLSEEEAGSEAVISLIVRPRRGKAELRSLDAQVVRAIKQGMDFETFMEVKKIRPTSGRGKVVKQLWCIRTGRSMV